MGSVGLAAPEPLPQRAEELPPMAAYATQFLRVQTGAIQAGIPFFPNATRSLIKPMPDTLYRFVPPLNSDPANGLDPDDIGGKFNVGIVGAGCAGLFTAMILNYLNSIPQLQKAGLNLRHEILEANGEDRLGGRLYTYKFPDRKDYPITDHEYFDVGGMRFPDNPVMKKTFQLFKLLGMTKEKDEKWDPWYQNPKPETIPTIRDTKMGQLIPYYMKGENCPMIFNGVQAVQLKDKDFMSAKDFKIDGLPGRIVTANPAAMVDDFVEEYRFKYHEEGPKAFWDLLMEKGDAYSVRQYLTNWARYDYNTIEFLETMNFGSRWYDQAFSEMVVDAMEFDYGLPGERVNWWCVMGGAQTLPKIMQNPKAPSWKDQLSSDPELVDAVRSLDKLNVQYKTKVTRIGYEWSDNKDKWMTPTVKVTCQNETAPRTYAAVFNTTTLAVQQHMSLEGLSLNWGTKQAIRSLGYGASSKVGIRFKTLWWMDEKHTFGKRIIGGVASTDESIGFCVYPSYNIEDPIDKPGVLLASYNWSQAAQRLSTLIDRASPAGEEALKELLFEDLARLHASQYVDPEDKDHKDPKARQRLFQERYETMYNLIKEQYLDHYAWDWYHDEQSAGAFAFFGPGQFKNMYPWVVRSNGTYMIIGEAASAHHAWVVGALESAVRAVYQFLWVRSRDSWACSEAAKLFVQSPAPGSEKCKLSSLFMELPPEFNRTDDVKAAGGADQSSPIGEYLRQGVFAEVCRLLQGQDQLNPGSLTPADTARYFPNVGTSTNPGKGAHAAGS